MTEEKLRSEIIYILTVKMLPSEAIPIVDRILTLFREAGWKSPEEIPNATICPKCNEMHWLK